MTMIISADDIKKTLPDYDPERSDVVHRESAKLADKAFDLAIKERPEPTVILLAGGAASGKTEYVSEYLKSSDAIIFDGTLPTIVGARIKIQRAKRYNKKVEVHFIFPASFAAAFDAFLHRDRKFPEEHFFRTQSAARQTILEIARHFTEVSIRVFESSTLVNEGVPNMRFREVIFDNPPEMIAYLRQNQYNESEIKAAILKGQT